MCWRCARLSASTERWKTRRMTSGSVSGENCDGSMPSRKLAFFGCSSTATTRWQEMQVTPSASSSVGGAVPVSSAA